MLKSFPKHWMYMGAFLIGTSLLTTGCIDDNYDLDNVDLTMGLGSEGLTVTMGNTEKILLEDIIDVDETVKLDDNNLYYLVKGGKTDFKFHVREIKFTYDETVVPSTQRVLSFESALAQMGKPVTSTSCVIPKNFTLQGEVSGNSHLKIKVENIKKDIVSLNKVTSKDLAFSLFLNMNNTPGVKLTVDKVQNFKIEIPSLLRVKSVSPGWTLKGHTLEHNGDLIYDGGKICTFEGDTVYFGKYGTPQQGVIEFGEEVSKVAMSGKVFFKASDSFTMTKNDYADVSVSVDHARNDHYIRLQEITGCIDPDFDVEDEVLDIAGSIPDFLKDDKVRIKVSNPTLNFVSDMTTIPTGLNFNADVVSVKEGENGFRKPITLPMVPIDEKVKNHVYYYQQGKPYDPNGVTPNAKIFQVDNLSDLIEVVPDFINVKFDDGRITVQRKDFTLGMGRDYESRVDYNVYIPFEFDKGLTIVYRDSTNSFKDDLEDYGAEGVHVSAEVENTIPLELLATATAVDVKGNPVPGIHFSTVTIAASEDGVTPKKSTLSLEADLDDPLLLQKMDKIKFNIESSNKETTRSHQLRSTQYLILNKINLKLKGQIVADFN